MMPKPTGNTLNLDSINEPYQTSGAGRGSTTRGSPCPSTVQDLAYSVPRGGYVYRLPDGAWSRTALSRAAVTKHLIGVGYVAARAREILSENLHHIVHGEVCDPGQPSVFGLNGRLVINNYRPPTVLPQRGEYTTLAKLIEVVCGKDDAAARWLRAWMAFKVQNPARRSMTAPVLMGAPGIGKTLLGLVLAEILGRANAAELHIRDLASDFNGHYADKLLVIANEVGAGPNAADLEPMLKAYITEPEVSLNSKGIQQHGITNRMSWIITSNAEVPVLIDSNDRRFSVFEAWAPPTARYSRQLARLHDPAGGWSPLGKAEIAALAFDLMRMRVNPSLVRTPLKNEARERLIAASAMRRPASRTRKMRLSPTTHEHVDGGVHLVIPGAIMTSVGERY